MPDAPTEHASPRSQRSSPWIKYALGAALLAVAGLPWAPLPLMGGASASSAEVEAERRLMVLPTHAQTVWTGDAQTTATQRQAPPPWALTLADPLNGHRNPAISAAPVWSPHLAAQVEAQEAEEARRAAAEALTQQRQAAVQATSEIEQLRPTVAELPEATVATPVRSGPKITIVLTAVGLNEKASRAALSELPAEIAVAVAPVAKAPERWVRDARAQGRAVLVEVPLQPRNYPRLDPGPLTLLTASSAKENVQRIQRILRTVPGVDGIATYLGGDFVADPTALGPLIDFAERQQLHLFETGRHRDSHLLRLAQEADTPATRAHLSLDANGSGGDVDAALQQLEKLARRNGSAVGVGVAVPQTVEAVRRWSQGLERRGLYLARIGA